MRFNKQANRERCGPQLTPLAARVNTHKYGIITDLRDGRCVRLELLNGVIQILVIHFEYGNSNSPVSPSTIIRSEEDLPIVTVERMTIAPVQGHTGIFRPSCMDRGHDGTAEVRDVKLEVTSRI
ncbi:jg21778 [Pararge aegeria aegeria]|uniref:Jg21778 protein n=1 Tax=Pararge aegeria aegeria TaxID=348720 RepID=A0A8S4R3H5_9NEOP|nr:jg21778 [Pararge aegeria aegeria]